MNAARVKAKTLLKMDLLLCHSERSCRELWEVIPEKYKTPLRKYNLSKT